MISSAKQTTKSLFAWPFDRNYYLQNIDQLSKYKAIGWAFACINSVCEKDGYYDQDRVKLQLLIDKWNAGFGSVKEARQLAFFYHEQARKEEDRSKSCCFRAFAHLVATIHTKNHAIYVSAYLLKAIAYRYDKETVFIEAKKQIDLFNQHIAEPFSA
jgi:hypothetical protein